MASRRSRRAPEYADVHRLDTFPKVLADNAKRFPQDIALREKDLGIWKEVTWAEYGLMVRLYALGLKDLGVERGQVIALLGANRPEWLWGEIAAHALGCASLGIYKDVLDDEADYLLAHSGAVAVIAEDEEQVDKLLTLAARVPSLRHIVYCDPRGLRKYSDPRLISQDDLKARGRALDARDPGLYEREVAAGHGDDVAVLCTTSGTTARPKLAMLQAGAFLRHCLDYLEADPRHPGDDYVSVLPLPWIMEQVYAVGQALIARGIVNFVEEEATTMADLREIGPRFVLLAPRVWEGIAADVRARMMDASPFKRAMFEIGMGLGKRALARNRRSWLAEALLFRALRDRLGFSFLTSAATGGAAMGPETFSFFHAMGVPLKQLYGQTELAGAYVIHRAGDIDPETVGLPFAKSAVRIDNPDAEGVGEILGRDQGLFAGYFGAGDATAIDDLRDGWLHTGDAGFLKKENGHLVVIDRVKDLAVMSNGVRFSPQFIENKLKFSAFIAEAVILGRDRPYLAAIICIRWSILAKWAEQRAISFTGYSSLAARPEVYALLRAEVERVNASLPAAQRVRKFLLLYKELDPDDGELTRTRKVRRGVVAEKYAKEITALYQGDDAVDIDTHITFQDGTTARIQTRLKVETLISADENGPIASKAAE
ncbi:long-chain fatty acid--CoA ligase [Rhodospirillum rubrum]|uniref:AMP-dependent synthetase and ligase n=1 Tax=Rhodospirillum rubrum (strain ATCC 11170 / ATH 1.1.1 / DSM 467 / LMG 4362 / NCIMB 8255 / S1) TaxID=269796 RepID=Q2RNJ2_RHORT|nr:long-chain fatty acid--CoA ligase [Rhodospirillum rubrum]ABC24303.1 AMP-dependent synthetase and ligase [Rhodospirillum rubrum ATCC 11170]AEO50054.1 AMP-dependent synthetase and ligase [Rhodospirillum rubrum F11]MBK5956022.1 long-chain fatty acid--CoA ligase [Rhodospirillum rubrum]QXG80230.1 long-chain fatty acid--CoA ligase [Rhodospirillum rubrum]HAP99571.1 long-chain fatty acid--CoA ligase [Rhodospirillum rubrum]